MQSQCPQCNGMGFFRQDVMWDDPNFGKLVKCDHPYHQPERVKQLESISGLIGADLNVRLSDIDKSASNAGMIDAAQQIIADRRGWLYIWGTYGNAKTIALTAIVNQLNENGHGPAMYTTLTAIIDWMRESFREQKLKDSDPAANLGYIQRFDKLKAIKCLAIDEMDKARDTAFAEEFCFSFLDERYRQAYRGETITIFAGNSNPSLQPPAIYDRVRDGRFMIVENKAASGRPVMDWTR